MGLLDDAIKEHLELKRRRGADAGEISRLESEALGPVPRSAEGVPDMSDTFEPPREEPAAATGEAPSGPPAPPPLGPQEDEGTAAHALAPMPIHEPPPAPRPSAHEPPPVMPPAGALPPAADPSPASSASAYEPPPGVPSAPPERQPWMTDDLQPEPEPEPAPAPEPEHESGGLFSRLRGGRRSKHEPEHEPEPPPPLAAHDPEAYEPPPVPRPSYDPPPPPVEHEPDIIPADDEPDVENLLEETPEFLEETPEHDRLWFEQRPPRDFNFDD